MNTFLMTAAAGADLPVWEKLLEVAAVGSVAGIGLSIAFALLIRGVVRGGAARREGHMRQWAGHALLATVAAAVCIAAVAGALVSMIQG